MKRMILGFYLLLLSAYVYLIEAKMNVDRLMKLAGTIRAGGKGSVRRFVNERRLYTKQPMTDDKRLYSTLRKLGVSGIPNIEEVNIFKDETVIQFPKFKL